MCYKVSIGAHPLSRESFWDQLHVSRVYRLSSLLTAATLLSGCLQPAISAITPSPEVTQVDSESNGWEMLSPGLERRVLFPGGNYPLTQFTVIRIDPAQFAFRVHYRPGEPLSLAEWRDALPDAVGFINANFFDAQAQILGLLISDGVSYGTAYSNRGGVFYTVGDVIGIRSTVDEPYRGEAYDQAVQAFPMLVSAGQAAFTNSGTDRASRRTVIALDTRGRVLVIVSSSLIGMRLIDLSAYLPTVGLDIAEAVNLDGGGSTMLYMNTGSIQVSSFDPVPAVLAIYTKVGTR